MTSEEETDYRLYEIDYSVGVLQFTFGFISTVLNVMVVIGFLKIGTKGKIANVLYCTLSVSDTLTGISSMVYSILLLDKKLDLLTGDESFFNVFKLKEGFRICVWMGPLFAFSMMMTISLINAITFCRTFAVAAPFYYKLYLRTEVVLVVVMLLAAHAFTIGIIPLINDVHVYFLDAHSGICAIIPLPGLDSLLKTLQLWLVTIPITLHCAMVVFSTFVLIYYLQQRRKKMSKSKEPSKLAAWLETIWLKVDSVAHMTTLCSCLKMSSSRRDSIKESKKKIQSLNSMCSTENADKSTQRAERTVLGLLLSFSITYVFWLAGFYMQVHATHKVELPAAWFGITPHVSYYVFRSDQINNKHTEKYFHFTAYGPLLLVLLVLMNSVINPSIHIAFNEELRRKILPFLKNYEFFESKEKSSGSSSSSMKKKKVVKTNTQASYVSNCTVGSDNNVSFKNAYAKVVGPSPKVPAERPISVEDQGVMAGPPFVSNQRGAEPPNCFKNPYCDAEDENKMKKDEDESNEKFEPIYDSISMEDLAISTTAPLDTTLETHLETDLTAKLTINEEEALASYDDLTASEDGGTEEDAKEETNVLELHPESTSREQCKNKTCLVYPNPIAGLSSDTDT